MGETVLLDDDVCQALLRYAQALAETKRSDVVTIPFIAARWLAVRRGVPPRPGQPAYATPAPDIPSDGPEQTTPTPSRTSTSAPGCCIRTR